MLIRKFKKNDQEGVEGIFALHWTDPEFLKELSNELESYTQTNSNRNSGFFIAERNKEILGIVGFRKLPDYLMSFALTNKPVELYVIAVKHKRTGVGRILKLKLIEEVNKSGFSEILLYSPGSHNDSWKFHDILGFERIGEVTPPEDDIGQVWRKIL
jgi:L-amino acid N-acyltransferase YncA